MIENNKTSERERDTREWHTPGILLRKARREKGLGLEDICDQLGLTQRVVKALESDDYDKLPGEVYLRGYIKRYSAVLGLEEESLLACFDDFYCEVKGGSDNENLLDVNSRQRRNGFAGTAWWGGKGLLTVVVVVALIAVAFWASGLQSEEKPNTADPANVQAGIRTAERQQAGPAADNETANSESDKAETKHTDTANIVAETAPATPPDPNRLDMTFASDSWIEVVDASGKILAVDLKRAGSEIKLEGTAPFDVLLGYAAGVSVRYLGKPVAVSPQPGSQTARLVIGK